MGVAVYIVLLVAQAAGRGDAGVAAIAPPRGSLLAPIGSKATVVPGPDYELRRGAGGELVYDGAGFTARIARDGTVSFRDKHLTLTLLPLFPHARGPHGPITSVPSLESVIRGRGKVPAPPPPDVVEQSSTAYGARLPVPTVTPYRPDPREACSYPAPCFFAAAVVFVSVNGQFDVTDELMRLAGQDPYRFAKARFLAGTRDLRVRLAARAHAEDLRRSIADLPARLVEIACDDGRSLRERRAVLEALAAELDIGSAEGREAAQTIGRLLAGLERNDGGVFCPAR